MRELDKLICGEVFNSHELVRNFRSLCLDYGGRFCGSEAGAEAAIFLASQLQEYKLKEVRREFFDMVHWNRGEARLRLVEPVDRHYDCLALPYAPPCDAVFPIVDLGMGHPGDFAAHANEIAGRMVLVDDRNPPAGPVLHRLEKYLPALKAGAGAFVFVAGLPGLLAPTGSLACNHGASENPAIPAVGMSQEAAAELRAMARSGPLKARLVLRTRLGRGRDCNVIGDCAGDAPRNRVIVVCAHHDGHDIAQGAADNASGTAAVLEVARVLAPLRQHLCGTVRCVLFGGEEMGLVGSHAYVHMRRERLDHVRFVFNLDAVGSVGAPQFSLQNAPELLPFFERVLSELVTSQTLDERIAPFSDHFPFVLQGVPAAFLTASRGSGDRGWGHTAADTFEKVSVESMQRAAALVARLVLRVDREEDWPGLRKDPICVRAGIATRGIEKLLKFEGHWPFADGA